MTISPYYLDLVADAALKSFWRKKTLALFLRRCGIAEQFLAGWLQEESKRDFLFRLFPKLEASGDKGLRLINAMAEVLVQQESFPDLEDWEDAAKKKADAKAAVTALKHYCDQQRDEVDNQREQEAARRRAEQIRGDIQSRRSNLAKLTSSLEELSREIGSQSAGYDFQTWFYDLADHFEIHCRRPYNADGRQIDGSITVEGTTYLVELKFTQKQSSSNDIDSLYKKVTSKADNTMGVIVSMSGFASTAINEASSAKTPLLLLDHSHMYLVLNGGLSLQELISRVRRHASQTGRAYLPAADFGGY